MPVPEFDTMYAATFNIAVEGQGARAGRIAEFLTARADGTPGIAILTEIVAVNALDAALTREMGQANYDFDTVPTGSPYGDSVSVLAYNGCTIADSTETVTVAGNKKMPHLLKANLETPLGSMSVAALRGAYMLGKASLSLRTPIGGREREAQYRTSVEILEDEQNIALIGGDMNSPASKRDPAFAAAGYRRLTGDDRTWPDREGIKVTTLDARVIAQPFLLLDKGTSIDAIYGRGPVKSTASEAVETGLSDHFYLEAQLERTSPKRQQLRIVRYTI